MKNRAFFILISVIGILVLAACGNSSPVQTGMPTSTPKPTAKPASEQSTSGSTSSQSSPGPLSISISSTSTQDSSSINVHTLPGAAVTIDLTYCGQTSHETKYADSAGDYILNWKPDSKCGGIATAKITASSNGQSATSSTSFSIS